MPAKPGIRLSKLEQHVLTVLNGQSGGYLADPGCAAFLAEGLDEEQVLKALKRLKRHGLADEMQTDVEVVSQIAPSDEEWNAYHVELEKATNEHSENLEKAIAAGAPLPKLTAPAPPEPRIETEVHVTDKGWAITDAGYDHCEAAGLTLEQFADAA